WGGWRVAVGLRWAGFAPSSCDRSPSAITPGCRLVWRYLWSWRYGALRLVSTTWIGLFGWLTGCRRKASLRPAAAPWWAPWRVVSWCAALRSGPRWGGRRAP